MLFIMLSLACVLLTLGVCIYSIHNNKIQKSAYLNLLCIAIFITIAGNYVEAASKTVEGSMVGVELTYLGLPFIPVLWYLCILEFCGIVIRSRTLIFALLVVPALVTYLAFTWEHNHLLFSASHYLTDNHFGQLRFEPGPLYFIRPLYLYAFILLGVATIIIKYAQGTRRFRQQSAYFLVSALIPALTLSNYLVEIDQSWFDITPYGLAFGSVLFLAAHHRYGISNYASAIKNSVIRELHEGIVIFDPNGIFLDSNKIAKDIFPELSDIRIGTSIEEMEYLPFDSAMVRGRQGVILEYVNNAGVLPRTYNLSISRILEGTRILGYCAVAHNITPLKSAMNELEERAYTDVLTGFFNRGYFFEKANHHTARAFLAREPLCIIMFDLDHFKSVNDNHGHAGGDFVLKEIAALVKRLLRKTDLLGRYGGEEFCIALPGTDLPEAIAKAEEIRREIANHHFLFDGNTIPVTTSLGVSVLDNAADGNTVDSIVKRADANLYQAKQQGRNRVVSDSPQANAAPHDILEQKRTKTIFPQPLE